MSKKVFLYTLPNGSTNEIHVADLGGGKYAAVYHRHVSNNSAYGGTRECWGTRSEVANAVRRWRGTLRR